MITLVIMIVFLSALWICDLKNKIAELRGLLQKAYDRETELAKKVEEKQHEVYETWNVVANKNVRIAELEAENAKLKAEDYEEPS